MDSPFNQGRGNGQSSTPPQKPVGGSNYQVNVNRTKTKKWVEAKVQNYDGDDWGADEYDDDAAEPASPVTQRTPATQPTSTQQTSTQQTSTQQTLTQPTSTQPTSTQPASTQSPSTQTPSRQSPVTQSPVMHSSGNPPGAAATSLPSAPNPLDVARAPYAATGVPSSPANQSQPIADPPSSSSPPVRERTVSPPPAAAATATNAVAAAALPDELVQKTSEQPPSSVRPSNVRTRANEEDTLDQRSPRPGPNDGDQTSSRSDSLWRDGSLSPNPESGVGARPANPLPKLPSVVRMSTFAPNLFLSTGGAFFSDPGMTSSDGRGSASPSLRDGSTPPPLPRTITPTSTTVEREPMPAMKGVLLPAQEKPAMSREPIVSHELSVTKAVPLATIDSYTAVKSTAKARNDEAAEAKRKTEARDPLPAHPAALVSETPERATPKPEAAASERTRKPPALSPQMGLDAVEPLRTQSPRGQTKLLDESRGSDAARAADQTPVEVEKETTPESVHLAPTYGSVASSPVKDSDILSDEILRSLSPGGKDAADPSFGQTVDHIQHAPSASTRDSRYTLKDYDSYWALTAAKPDPVGEESDSETAPPAPLAPDGKALPSNPPASSSATPAGSAEGTLLSEEEARIRRRFSWEAASRGVSPAPPGAPTASHEASETSQGAPTASREAPNAPHESPTASRGPTPASHEPPPATPAKSPPVSDGDADHGLRNRDAGVSESQPSVVGSVAASAAVSAVAATAAASAVASSHRPNSTLEPSPPVSALSDRQLLENKRLPSPKERTLTTQTPPRMVSPSPPLDSRLPRDPPTSQAAASQAVPFREIMGLPTSPERTAMFNASRDHYAVTDSGLDDWLDSIKDQHPEYTHGPVPFRAATSGQLGAAAGNMAPDALANTTTQQPYYQQYGASSTSSVTSPPSSRPRPGGPQTSQQASGGSLGHSGNQIGSKSKEFMQSAGKMGKGLLSKGRSKLRGSGDKEKADSSPPSVQPKVKNERRKSWGLGLGTRSASDEVTSPPRSHIAIQNDLANAAQVPPPTAVTASAPLHPSTPQRQGQHWAPTSGQAIQTDREQTPPFQGPPPSTPVGRAVAGLSRLEIPPGRPSVQSDGVGIGIEHPGGADDGRKQPQGEATREHGLDEWVTVPQQSNNQGPAANMLPSVSTTQREASVPAFEHSGVSVPSQPPVDDNEPKRDSSFIGLPPIRRSSTFALTSKVKRKSRRTPGDDAKTDGDGVLSHADEDNTRAVKKPAEPEEFIPLPAPETAQDIDIANRQVTDKTDTHTTKKTLNHQEELPPSNLATPHGNDTVDLPPKSKALTYGAAQTESQASPSLLVPVVTHAASMADPVPADEDGNGPNKDTLTPQETLPQPSPDTTQNVDAVDPDTPIMDKGNARAMKGILVPRESLSPSGSVTTQDTSVADSPPMGEGDAQEMNQSAKPKGLVALSGLARTQDIGVTDLSSVDKGSAETANESNESQQSQLQSAPATTQDISGSDTPPVDESSAHTTKAILEPQKLLPQSSTTTTQSIDTVNPVIVDEGDFHVKKKVVESQESTPQPRPDSTHSIGMTILPILNQGSSHTKREMVESEESLSGWPVGQDFGSDNPPSMEEGSSRMVVPQESLVQAGPATTQSIGTANPLIVDKGSVYLTKEKVESEESLPQYGSATIHDITLEDPFIDERNSPKTKEMVESMEPQSGLATAQSIGTTNPLIVDKDRAYITKGKVESEKSLPQSGPATTHNITLEDPFIDKSNSRKTKEMVESEEPHVQSGPVTAADIIAESQSLEEGNAHTPTKSAEPQKAPALTSLATTGDVDDADTTKSDEDITRLAKKSVKHQESLLSSSLDTTRGVGNADPMTIDEGSTNSASKSVKSSQESLQLSSLDTTQDIGSADPLQTDKDSTNRMDGLDEVQESVPVSELTTSSNADSVPTVKGSAGTKNGSDELHDSVLMSELTPTTSNVYAVPIVKGSTGMIDRSDEMQESVPEQTTSSNADSVPTVKGSTGTKNRSDELHDSVLMSELTPTTSNTYAVPIGKDRTGGIDRSNEVQESVPVSDLTTTSNADPASVDAGSTRTTDRTDELEESVPVFEQPTTSSADSVHVEKGSIRATDRPDGPDEAVPVSEPSATSSPHLAPIENGSTRTINKSELQESVSASEPTTSNIHALPIGEGSTRAVDGSEELQESAPVSELTSSNADPASIDTSSTHTTDESDALKESVPVSEPVSTSSADPAPIDKGSTHAIKKAAEPREPVLVSEPSATLNTDPVATDKGNTLTANGSDKLQESVSVSEPTTTSNAEPAHGSGGSAPMTERSDELEESVPVAESTASKDAAMAEPAPKNALQKDVSASQVEVQDENHAQMAVPQHDAPTPTTVNKKARVPPPLKLVKPSREDNLGMPVQQTPPLGTGPWKLEESYLSEPLHTVSRNRPGTSGSQHVYGFDQRTGLPLLSPPPASSRTRTAAMPPLSSQRWPELFSRPGQNEVDRSRANMGPGHPPVQQYQMAANHQEPTISGTQFNDSSRGDVVSPDDDRGRGRRGSGIFKGIGDRLARATSRDRRKSVIDSRPSETDSPVGERAGSIVSVGDGQERNSRRSSIVFGRIGRASTEDRTLRKGSKDDHQANTETQASIIQPQPQSDRRHSILSAGASDRVPTPTSTQANDSTSVLAASIDEKPATKKRRFSSIIRVAGIKNMLTRSGNHDNARSSNGRPPTLGSQPPEHLVSQNQSRGSTKSSFERTEQSSRGQESLSRFENEEISPLSAHPSREAGQRATGWHQRYLKGQPPPTTSQRHPLFLQEALYQPRTGHVRPQSQQLNSYSPQGAVASQRRYSQQVWPGRGESGPLQGPISGYEPRYAQVPIPMGYSTVRGEGIASPMAFHTPRRMSLGPYNPYQPRMFPTGDVQRQVQQAPLTQRGLPERSSTQSPGGFPFDSTVTAERRRVSAGDSFAMAKEPSIISRSTLPAIPDDGSQENESRQLRSSGHAVEGSSSHTSDGKPAPVDSDSAFSHSKPADQNRASEGSKMPEPAAKVAMNDDKGKNAARDIFDTAPLNKDSTGESQRHAATSRTVSDDGISSAGEVKKPTVVESSGPAAELDDTADRYERRRRLESQEEKIFYSPEDDDDYQPQMSATSYPGQEWNPFGESEPWQDE